MGTPGAGKGTQAQLLEQRRGIPQISTGDIFRALASEKTPLALEVRAVQAAGKLISDELVIRVVRERTDQDDCRHGYILDGFPRTPVQAEMLEQLAAEQGHTMMAILVDVPLDLLEKRITGRLTCPAGNEIYNVHFKPPLVPNFCDQHPDVALVQRADDSSDKLKTRFDEYERNTRPLLEYYRTSGRLFVVDGTRAPESIYSEIEAILTGHGLATA